MSVNVHISVNAFFWSEYLKQFGSCLVGIARVGQWLSGRVLDERWRVAGSSLTGGTGLCP